MNPFLFDPLGFRLDGRPFWATFGGDGETGGGGEDSDSDDDDADGDDDKDEKDPVKTLKSTLEKVTAERRAVRDEYRPVKAVLRELGIDSPEALRAALTKGAGAGKGGEQQVDVEKIRQEAKTEATLEANRELALARVETLASSMFEDPDDAVDHLRKNVDDLLGRDGKPSKDAIKRELEDLLTAKPHWGKAKQGDIDFDGGARQSGGAPKGMDGFLRQVSRAKRGG